MQDPGRPASTGDASSANEQLSDTLIESPSTPSPGTLRAQADEDAEACDNIWQYSFEGVGALAEAMDVVNVTPKPSAALASPKLVKSNKSFVAYNSVPAAAFGCEHIQGIFQEKRKLFVNQYLEALQSVFDRPMSRVQTYKLSPSEASKGAESARPSIMPTFLCLQCPFSYTQELRNKHSAARGHAFSVESRSGSVYCQQCEDYVYDPSLEELRLSKGRRKRKHDEIADAGDDARLVFIHTQNTPCRANGLRGLYNMGQTCFMSVVIQSLIHNPFMRSFFLSEGHRTEECEKEACISCALDEMLSEFHSVEKVEGYGAVNLLMGSWMSAQALAGYQQQDAHEYMQFIMHALHTENGGTEGHSQSDGDCSCIIHNIFYGKLQSTVTCDKCKNTTTAVDPVMDLSLDIRSQVKKRKLEKLDGEAAPRPDLELKDCLARFTGREKLAAGSYSCQNCSGDQSAVKQLSIQRLPPALPIHLKRFEHAKMTSKLEAKIRFPLELDMYPYTNVAQKSKAGKQQPVDGSLSCVYDLSSVVVHKGKAESGHYVCYTRISNEWFLFDDSKVVLSNTAEVMGAEAYMLFYIIKSIDD